MTDLGARVKKGIVLYLLGWMDPMGGPGDPIGAGGPSYDCNKVPFACLPFLTVPACPRLAPVLVSALPLPLR